MENTQPKYQTIMLIDDSDIDNMVNKHIIRKNEICEEILVHTSAISALDYLKKLEQDRSAGPVPDVILLDINMPIMNGFGFLEHYSHFDKELTSQIKVIMLTSSVDPNDIRRSEDNPFVSGFISKPLSAEHLSWI